MKKFVKNFRAAFKEPANVTNKSLHEDKDVPDPKFIVVNPPNLPNPSPAPAPPYPHPDNKGLSNQNHSVQQNNNEDIGTFGGLGSWMASFEPDPNARGVVEVAAGPIHDQNPQEVSEVLTLEEGKSTSISTMPGVLHFIRVRSLLDNQVDPGQSEESRDRKPAEILGVGDRPVVHDARPSEPLTRETRLSRDAVCETWLSSITELEWRQSFAK